MNSSIQERDKALSILETQAFQLSTVFRQSYLSSNRGAILLYTDSLENGYPVGIHDYRAKKESINLFNSEKSRNDLEKLINNYDPKKEGILIIITKSNATWFATFKLKFRK